MKRITAILTFAGLALLLSACQDAPPRFTFAGTTTAAGVEQPLTLTFEQRGKHLSGEYLVLAAKGTFQGTLENTTLTAELRPGPDCTYSFEGSLVGNALTGAFEPAGCPGGQSGTWELERR